jgi:hypothetical protein
MVLRKHSDYFPIRHNLFAFITETGSNYCAVRAEPLSVTHVNQSDTGTAFLRILRFSSVSILPPALHILIHVHIALTKTNGRNLGTFQKAMSFGNRGAWELNEISIFGL